MTVPALAAHNGWQPEREEARRLLRQELERPEYAQAQPNPVLQWISERLRQLWEWLEGLGQGTGALPGWWLLIVVLAVAVVLLLVIRPHRNLSTRRRAEGAVLTDRRWEAQDHRRLARQASDAGDHGQALAAWFRALVREAEQRTVLSERPGRTATEAAESLAVAFGAEAEALRTAATLFNAVRYGHHTATDLQAARVRELDARLTASALPEGAQPGPGPGRSPGAGMVVPR